MDDQPLHKYDTNELTDPLVRCVNCAKLVHREFISLGAGCFHCGNKRVQIVQGLDDKLEIEPLANGTYDLGLKDYTIDPEYLAAFAPPGSDKHWNGGK